MNYSFFELEELLSTGERKELFQFAQVPILKASKKSLEMLELLTRVPAKMDTSEKKILWLRRKLFFKDKDDRNFRRTCRQAEQLYYDFVAFQNSRTGPGRLFSIIESLMDKPLDKQLESKLADLEETLPKDDHPHTSNFLRHYLKSDFKNQYLSKRRKQKDYEFDETLKHLDQFYLIEKLKYGIYYLQVARVLPQEIPGNLAKELQQLCDKHQDLIQETSILKLYYKAYQGFYTKVFDKKEELLQLLQDYPDALSRDVKSDLSHLMANYLIGRIVQLNQALPDLRRSYEDFYQFNQYLLKEGLLKEQDYIPQRRFRNIIGSALNVGTSEGIIWAEDFLDSQLAHVHPEEQEKLESFCRAAIHFYKKEYEECLKLKDTRTFSDRLYYCDIKTLYLRTLYELDDADLVEKITNVIRTIEQDDQLKVGHKQMYNHFFTFLKLLYKLREMIGSRSEKLEQLEQLEFNIIQEHPVAQKKWLLEKTQDLRGKRYW